MHNAWDRSFKEYSSRRDWSRQNYIPGNVDPKDGGAQDVITGAEPGGENVSGADRCVEEEAGRIRSITRKKEIGIAKAQATAETVRH